MSEYPTAVKPQMICFYTSLNKRDHRRLLQGNPLLFLKNNCQIESELNHMIPAFVLAEFI